jgi:hypothetical protein
MATDRLVFHGGLLRPWDLDTDVPIVAAHVSDE